MRTNLFNMQILKIILLVIVVIIAIPLIIALFVSNDYKITRSIIINKPQQEVFDYIKLIKNQEQYSKWVMTDPNMKKTFTGPDGTVGFIYAWDSKNKQAGKGEQEIKKINDGEGIDIEVRFEKPFKGIANTPIHTEAISRQAGREYPWRYEDTCHMVEPGAEAYRPHTKYEGQGSRLSAEGNF